MKKYRKKPVIVEAVQYDGNNRKEIKEWCGNYVGVNLSDENDSNLYISTLEGTMNSRPGDWIIKELFSTNDRKFYPCKPDIFEATYEEVVE